MHGSAVTKQQMKRFHLQIIIYHRKVELSENVA